jgi:hypothetical protein
MTYEQFKSLVVAYLDQTGNPEVTNQVDAFIELAETFVNRRVRVREMLSTVLVTDLATLVGSDTVYPVPSDFLEAEGVWGDAQTWDFYDTDQLRRLGRQYADTGVDCYGYGLLGDYLVFLADPSPTLTLTYYAKPPVLSAQAGEIATTLFPKLSDLYLYSTLVEAAPFLRDNENGQVWARKRESILAEVMLSNWDSRIPRAQTLKR